MANLRDLDPELLVELSAENTMQLILTKSSLRLLRDLLDAYMKPESLAEESFVEEVDGPQTCKPIYCVRNMVGRTLFVV